MNVLSLITIRKYKTGDLSLRGGLQAILHMIWGFAAMLLSLCAPVFMPMTAMATPFTETVPGGLGPIPATYPPVGGTMFVFVGANGNIYYQFVNPSTQFRGFAGTGTPTAFQGIPVFQLGPTQALNCGILSCNSYFGGSIVEGYARLTVRDADACPGNFDFDDVTFLVNGIPVSSLSNLPANSVERTNFAGTTTIGTENCFRNQGGGETSTSWFNLSSSLLSNILTLGGTTPFIQDDDTGSNTTRGDNFWFFTDGNDATGTPEVAPGIEIIKTADRTSYSAPGDIINYSFEVNNIGSVVITNIVVTDTFITGSISCPTTTLASGASMTCTASHTVSQTNIDDDIVFVNTADVSGVPTEGTLGAVSGTLTIPGPTANNSMTLTKTASPTTDLAVGDTVTYTYITTNTGNITLDNVNITDVQSGSGALSAITPATATLAPGASQSFSATYIITQADIDAGADITNIATGNSTPRRGSISAPTDSASVSLAAPSPAITLDKQALTPIFENIGDLLDYSYLVANMGDVSISDLVVTDDKITSVSCPVTELAPGATTLCTASYTVTQSDLDLGSVINNASAQGTPSAGTLIPATDSVTVTGVQNPAMAFVKTATVINFELPGDISSYSYVVTNSGNTTLTDPIIVSDDRIASVTCPALPSGGLIPGASLSCTADYTVTQLDLDAGFVTNTASATSGPLTSPSASATIPVSQRPSVSLVKSALFSNFTTVGESVEYEFIVTNDGNMTLTGGINVEDDKIGTVSCITGNLTPGTSQSCRANYTVTQSDLDLGRITNQAFAQNGTLVSPTVAVTVNAIQSPAIVFSKRAITADFANAGDVIAYEFDVENAGNVTLTAIDISDDLVASVECPQSTLVPGENIICTASYAVNQSDVDTGFVTNNASVSGTPPAGAAPISQASSVTVNSNAVSSLRFNKRVLAPSFNAVGDVLAYEFDVENTGMTTLSNLVIADDIIAAVSCPVTVLTPGATTLCAGSYTVTQADLDAGEVINRASAQANVPDGSLLPPVLSTATSNAVQTPSLTLAKTSGDTVFSEVGDRLTYSYLVTNTGNVEVSAVSVTDDKIAVVTCPPSVLAPTQSLVCTAEYTVNQIDIDAGFVTNSASAFATPRGGILTPATDSLTITGDQAFGLSLEKTANVTAFGQVGDIIDYSYVVTNSGNTTITDAISISDDKILSVNCPALPGGELAPSQSLTCTASYAVTQVDIDNGFVTNLATASDGNVTSPQVSESVSATQNSALTLVKAGSPDNFSTLGQTLTYSYVVTNTGNVSITDPIRISDDRISAVSCPALPTGGLAPETSLTCSGTDSVTQLDLDAGRVTNIATATDGTTTTSPVSETLIAEALPGLSLAKNALSTDYSQIGDVIEYSYIVTNTGNVSLTDPIVISDDKIDSVACPALPSAGLAPADTLTCMASDTITQADIDNGSITNIASAASGSSASTPVSVTINAIQSAELSIEKSASQSRFTAPGESVLYTYLVRNSGNVTLNGGLEVSDDKIDTVTCPALPASGFAPDTEVSCTASYIVTQDDIDAGVITNIASAAIGSTRSPSDSVTVTATQSAALSLTKSVAQSDYETPGDVLDYTFIVTNSGNVTLIDPVTITDSRIASISCPALPATGLLPGGSITCTASDFASQSDIDIGEVVNTASASDGNVTSALVEARVSARQMPALEMVKTANVVNFTKPGDISTYEYLVTNSGNVTLTAPVSVTDNLIPTVNCPALPSGGLAPGASLTCSASYAATQADLDIGSVTNIATASSGALTTLPTSATIPVDATPAVAIVKTSPSPDFATLGQVLTYNYEITNQGNITLTGDVSVTDDKIGTIVCFSGNFAPEQIESCSATYIVTQADLDNGSLTNSAFVTHPWASSEPVFLTLPAVQRSALTLVKIATTTEFSAVGDTLEYSYLVTNSGNVTVTTPIVVSDDRIATVSCPSLPAGGLVPEASLSCTGTDVVTQADIDLGSVTNIATATDGTTVSPEATVTVNGAQTAALTLVKTATTTEFSAVGDTLEYSYLVTNSGNVTVTTPIVVSDDRIATVSCPSLPAGGLVPEASLSCTGTDVVTQADIDLGSVTNIATATDGTTVSPEATVTVNGAQTAALTLVKTATTTEFSAVGDTLEYSYLVTNSGNVTVTTPIVVSDDRIATVSCPSLPAGGLVPEASLSCTGTDVVTQADIDLGSVTNIATATDGTTVSPEATVTVNGAQTAALTLVKTATTTEFSTVGDTLEYSYLVTNSGNVTVTTPIVVSDDRIATVSCPSLPAGGLVPEASLSCTGTDVVTQADIDLGSVTNIATATDGTTVSPEATVTVNGAQTAAFILNKMALSVDFTAVGDVLSYAYIVTNTGNTTLTQAVTIVDDKIETVTCPELPEGGILPGNNLTCLADYNVTQADIDLGFVTNVAMAVINGVASAPDTVTIQGLNTSGLTLVKSAFTTSFAQVGDILVYDYSVTNSGATTTQPQISIFDDKIASVTCPVQETGLAPGATINCFAVYSVTEVDVAAGFVTNTAHATDGNIVSPNSIVTVELVELPIIDLEKRAVTTVFSTPGDVISYEYEVTNIGNVIVFDPISVSDDKIDEVKCPDLSQEGLALGASVICSADYIATQADIDSGGVTNIASARTGSVVSNEATVTVKAEQNPEMSVFKTLTSRTQRFGPIFDVTYTITLENIGNTTLTDLSLEDSLAQMVAPATLQGTPNVVLDGFSGDANPDFDGQSNTELLSSGLSLNVGDTGTVTLSAQVDITQGSPQTGNTAFGNAAQFLTPIPSDDESVTPINRTDVNPTPLNLVDTDGDGAPDIFESSTEDRDGDGIPDSEDYDPTGYFYCEENGAILPGGGISVTGPVGSNSTIGTANNIVILQDGSNGFFQFFVTEPGRYSLTPRYPNSGVPSTSRRPEAEPLDVSSVSGNPAILGSSEVGDTGELADASAAANTPFYFEFDIEAGDPSVFLNNIPLKHCGTPELSLTKTVSQAPRLIDDGRQQVIYQLTANNIGQTLIENVRVDDNLAAVFGADNVTVQECNLIQSPAGFQGRENANFDGVSDTQTLIGDGDLNPGDSLTIEVNVIIDAQRDGEHINTANLSASAPLDGATLTDQASASVDLLPLSNANLLRVIKTAQPRTVQIGDPVLYTISVTNESASTMTDLNIVDRLPEGFVYVPNSSILSDAESSLAIEPVVTQRGVLSWPVNLSSEAPVNALLPNETLSVSLRLLAGPNVIFGAHENQAFVESTRTGTRSDIATAIVDYIPEPSFDCTPIIGRVYDDVNHNGYPDDGEPGLPSVRLVTVNGDIITTDQYGRYHIPCAAIADSENGSNFLLKADIRTLPLGYAPTTENPRVIRATRGKFVKMNFGAGFRPMLRLELSPDDFNAASEAMSVTSVRRIKTVLDQNFDAERALLIYHARPDQNVDSAQAALKVALNVVRDLAPRRLDDIAMEASWGEVDNVYTDIDNDSSEQVTEQFNEQVTDKRGQNGQDRVAFRQNAFGNIVPLPTPRANDNDNENEAGGFESSLFERDRRIHSDAGAGLRGDRSDGDDDGLEDDLPDFGLESDPRNNQFAILGRRDATGTDTDSARPGRLLRWLGWGNSTEAYVDTMEIEVTTDALDPVKRLNVQTNLVSEAGDRTIRSEAYWNYDAFIKTAELRLFDAQRSSRGEPLLIVPFTGRYASLALDESLPPHLHYVLRVYGKDGGFDETAPKRLIIDEADYDLTGEEWARESDTAFGQSTLQLSNILVRGGTVRVYGRNVPGQRVTVLGQEIGIDENGRFVSEQLLPAGERAIDITVDGVNDTTKRIIRTVDVKARDVFYVAQIEGTVGQRINSNEVFEEGRVAFYVRSRLNDRWFVTATADTGEAALDDLVRGLDDKNLDQLLRRLDPDRYYPTFGDDSTIEQDAPTSGRVYARLERDDDYVLWGNYQTNFNDTEYGRVQRTLYGAKLNWDENSGFTKYGDERTSLTAFIAEGGTRQARDELRGTGGSVYYLRHGDISIGSEVLRIETRDSISDLVIESRRLTYGSDYDLDFIQGRIILNQPLGSSGDDGRLFRDGSNSGNQQILVADYEFTPIFGNDESAAVYGARARRWFGDHIKLGATYNHDTDGGQESDLYEADLTLQYAAGTYIKGEIAQSEGQGVETFRSLDGGFTFNPQARGGVSTIDGSQSARAYAVEAAINFDEIDGFNFGGTAYTYWRKRDAGFAGFAEQTNQDVEQYGGGLNLKLTSEFEVTARGDVTNSEFVGENSFAELRADYKVAEKLTASAGLSYNDDARGNSGTSLGGRIEYDFNDAASIYAFGQVGLTGDNTRTTDRLGVGGELRLTKHILGGGEISTGEDGLGARASLRYQYEDGDEYYLAYDLPLNARAQSNLGTFNIGARRRYGDALSIYGEERLQFNDRGLNGITHAYGVDYKPGNWNFGVSGEVGRVDQLDRQAYSGTVGFADDRIKAGVTGEWREDRDIERDELRTTWLLRATAQYQASEELRLQSKLNLAFSDQTEQTGLGPVDFNEAEFTEASLAAAYRPIWDDRFNLLAKLVYLEDLSPTNQRFGSETLNYRQRSEIISVDASYDILPKWTLGGKYAHRSGSVTSNRESLDFTESSADLGIIRLDYHATHKWDILLEGRYITIGDGAVSRTGGLAGIYRHINDNAKFGLGLTYGGIGEEYLSVLDEDDEDDWGWFINVIGKF